MEGSNGPAGRMKREPLDESRGAGMFCKDMMRLANGDGELWAVKKLEKRKHTHDRKGLGASRA
jgi:hypothetical protein